MDADDTKFPSFDNLVTNHLTPDMPIDVVGILVHDSCLAYPVALSPD